MIVLILGFIGLIIISAIADVKPGEDVIEPIALIGFIILCNLGYTLGWITEIFIKKNKNYGPKVFKYGLYFTLFFVLAPILIHIVLWITRGFKTMY